MSHPLRTAWIILLIGSLGACNLPQRGQDEEEIDPVEDEYKALLKQINQLDEKIATTRLAMSDYGKHLVQLVERVKSIEAIINAQDLRISELEARLKTGTPTATPAAPETPPAVTSQSPEEAASKIRDSLRALKDGKEEPTATLAAILPNAAVAASVLCDEIRANNSNYKYVDQLSALLAALPLDDCRPALAQALRDATLRTTIATIIGKRRDLNLSKLLEEYAQSPDEDERLTIGEALAQCGNPAGYPPLVSLLSSEQKDIRIIALSVLKSSNAGETFGYSALLNPAENAAAVAKWTEWAGGKSEEKK